MQLSRLNPFHCCFDKPEPKPRIPPHAFWREATTIQKDHSTQTLPLTQETATEITVENPRVLDQQTIEAMKKIAPYPHGSEKTEESLESLNGRIKERLNMLSSWIKHHDQPNIDASIRLNQQKKELEKKLDAIRNTWHKTINDKNSLVFVARHTPKAERTNTEIDETELPEEVPANLARQASTTQETGPLLGFAIVPRDLSKPAEIYVHKDCTTQEQVVARLIDSLKKTSLPEGAVLKIAAANLMQGQLLRQKNYDPTSECAPNRLRIWCERSPPPSEEEGAANSSQTLLSDK